MNTSQCCWCPCMTSLWPRWRLRKWWKRSFKYYWSMKNVSFNKTPLIIYHIRGCTVYPSAVAQPISCASWCKTHWWMSISCEGILKISMWHLRVSGRTVTIQWNCLYWRICLRRTICTPQSTWLWAHRSPPQKFQMSLLLQVVLYQSCVKISNGATRSHVVTSTQAFMSLCSDLHYLVKAFHWTDLYSTGRQGIHGSGTGKVD